MVWPVTAALRHYWRRYRPAYWLFPNSQWPEVHLSISSAQKVYTQAKRCSGLEKDGGIHSLRHAYATHQLENGLPIHRLQQQLGHSQLSTTQRYIHWVPNTPSSVTPVSDLVGPLEVAHGE